MSGYVSTVDLRSPWQRQSGLTTVPNPAIIGGFTSFPAGEVRFPTSTYSWRTGAGYSRAIASGTKPIPLSRGELLSFFGSGDTGHEFRKSWVENIQASVTINPGKIAPYLWRVQNGLPRNAPVILICSRQNYANPLVRYYPNDYSWTISDKELEDIGQSILTDVNPLQPSADLLVSIAELLMEGFPKPLVALVTRKGVKGRVELIGRLAREYLTYVFGVAPIVSDIRAISSTVHRVDDLVNQWIRNDKSSLRRRRRLQPRVVSAYSSDENQGNANTSTTGFIPSYSAATAKVGHAVYSSGGNPGGGSNDRWSFRAESMANVKTNISFSSMFHYDLSKILSSRTGLSFLDLDESSLREQLKLYVFGLSSADLSASLVWNLLPYSWLVDWLTNIGSILDQIRASQAVGLVTDWAYVKAVQERFVKHRFTAADGMQPLDSLSQYSSVHTFKQVYVRRLRATPFGFRTKFSGLSSKQLGILGALAASR